MLGLQTGQTRESQIHNLKISNRPSLPRQSMVGPRESL